VNTVHPGFTDTSMMGGLHKNANPDDPQQVMDAFAASAPIGRYAGPGEIAQLMLFLASDASSYCTGGAYVADGALLAYHGGPAPA
jgi:NAD(P)-dependent dehydrogenase (short-subunit alcohol dehydrogenase family)